MKGKIAMLMSLLLIVAGTIAGFFATGELACLTAFAVVMFGAGLAASTLWSKKKDTSPSWVMVVCMLCIGIGAFFAGIMKLFTEDTMTTLMGYVFSAIMIIVSLVIPYLVPKQLK